MEQSNRQMIFYHDTNKRQRAMNSSPFVKVKYDGNNRARTYDPLLVRQMLSQLSYAPIKKQSEKWCG